MMNIVLDMNLSPRWCSVLEAEGHACTHWSQIGEPTASDEVIMAWAKERGHVVLTHDLDFGAILACTAASGPSVVQLRAQDILPDTLGQLVITALARYERELTAGALIVVDAARARVRLLPLY
jgi:predicted nuclease of predicted toxin-antitoxin system